jgi:hypothetical protein
VACGWCGKAVAVPSRGRVPKWCSATCRNKAWQANHAPTGGPVRVVQQRVEVPAPTEPRNVEEWVELLELLTARLAQGRIYKRDLPALVPALNHLLDVTDRRIHER